MGFDGLDLVHSISRCIPKESLAESRSKLDQQPPSLDTCYAIRKREGQKEAHVGIFHRFAARGHLLYVALEI